MTSPLTDRALKAHQQNEGNVDAPAAEYDTFSGVWAHNEACKRSVWTVPTAAQAVPSIIGTEASSASQSANRSGTRTQESAEAVQTRIKPEGFG